MAGTWASVLPCAWAGRLSGYDRLVVHAVIVVGAGISGLTLARELRREGWSPVVLERARGVGGRCATRRVNGLPVDHGVAFLHGRTARFLSELQVVDHVTPVGHWPLVRDGDGSPCRPEAFAEHERRLAFAEGVNRFAKHLAAGLDVRLGANVVSLRAPAGSSSDDGGWALTLASGDTLRARAVAVTIPAPSALDLLGAMNPLPLPLARVLPLVGLIRMVPCLTVIASYNEPHATPAWDVSFPRDSAAIHSIVHDSAKRTAREQLMLVIQARPAWSRAHLHEDSDTWTAALLDEAAQLHGRWIAQPSTRQSHAWRKARVVPGTELAQPIAVQLDGGGLLGLAGDGFHNAGGVEGAYLSGVALAARFSALLTTSS